MLGVWSACSMADGNTEERAMMDGSLAAPSAREARQLFLLAVFGCALLIAVYQLKLLPSLAVPLGLLLPAAVAWALFLAIRLARGGASTAPLPWAVLGCSFIIGGALFDIGATLYHSLDLSAEANPIVRTLL